MKALVRERQKAITMRRNGATYREILRVLPVAKSTLSVWLKDLPLTDVEREYLRKRTDANISRGRARAASIIYHRRQVREQREYQDQAAVFERLKGEEMFRMGVAFYWAEGSNKAPMFHFVNSDSDMILFMYRWIQKYLEVRQADIGVRIYMHKVYSQHECELYWCRLLNLEKNALKKTIFKPTKHRVRKTPNYHGCVRLEVGGVDKYRAMMAWKKCLKHYILRELPAQHLHS